MLAWRRSIAIAGMLFRAAALPPAGAGSNCCQGLTTILLPSHPMPPLFRAISRGPDEG